jgi:hypothetical protein
MKITVWLCGAARIEGKIVQGKMYREVEEDWKHRRRLR